MTRSLTRLPGAGVVAAAALLGAGSLVGLTRCPLHEATGLWCPLCGGLRSLAALARGDLVAALHANLLAVALAVAGAVWAMRWTGRSVRAGTPVAGLALDARSYRPLAVVLVAFAVIRNTPLGAGLHP